MDPELKFSRELMEKDVLWDLDMQTEFRPPRRTGYSFVIDVLDGNPRLALYQLKINYSTSTTLSEQPPRDMLVKAVHEQGGHIEQDNLYHIDNTIRRWIEYYLLKKMK